jgi:hypothetical protein
MKKNRSWKWLALWAYVFHHDEFGEGTLEMLWVISWRVNEDCDERLKLEEAFIRILKLDTPWDLEGNKEKDVVDIEKIRPLRHWRPYITISGHSQNAKGT